MNFTEFWQILVDSPRLHFLFICPGNICRSPYAEMKFEQIITPHLPEIQKEITIASGGYIDQQFPIHPLTKRALLEEGIPEDRIDRFHARTMRKHKYELENASVIITMDRSTRDVLIAGKFKPKAITLAEIALDGIEIDIEDPARLTDYEEYLKIMTQIKGYLELILKKWRNLLNPPIQ
jgi:protein-tyrosine-phosphatase